MPPLAQEPRRGSMSCRRGGLMAGLGEAACHAAAGTRASCLCLIPLDTVRYCWRWVDARHALSSELLP